LIQYSEKSDPVTLKRLKESASANQKDYEKKKTLSQAIKEKIALAKTESQRAKAELKPAAKAVDEGLEYVSDSQAAQRIMRERTMASPGRSVYVKRISPQPMRQKADLVDFNAQPSGVGVMSVRGAGFYLERDGGFGLDSEQPFGIKNNSKFGLSRQSEFGVGDGIQREPALTMKPSPSSGGFGFGMGDMNKEPALSMGSGNNPKRKNVFSLR